MDILKKRNNLPGGGQRGHAAGIEEGEFLHGEKRGGRKGGWQNAPSWRMGKSSERCQRHYLSRFPKVRSEFQLPRVGPDEPWKGRARARVPIKREVMMTWTRRT